MNHFLLSLSRPFLFHSFSMADKPSVVFFIADDVSQEDFGCYGHPVIQTPRRRLGQARHALRKRLPDHEQLQPFPMQHHHQSLLITQGRPSSTSVAQGTNSFSRTPAGSRLLHCPFRKNHMFGNKDRAFDRITGGGGPGKEKDWVDPSKDRPKDKPFFFWFASDGRPSADGLSLREAPSTIPRK